MKILMALMALVPGVASAETLHLVCLGAGSANRVSGASI